MPLTATAKRMMDTLPSYYEGEPLIERIVQAWANEIDRLEARLGQIKDGLVPSLADDTLHMLALWEALLELPVAPAGATVNQRRAKVTASLRKLDSASASGYLAALGAALGNTGWVLLRDTPDPLVDTLETQFPPGTYNAGLIGRLVREMHPAHRQLVMHYTGGFLLDASELDIDTL